MRRILCPHIMCSLDLLWCCCPVLPLFRLTTLFANQCCYLKLRVKLLPPLGGLRSRPVHRCKGCILPANVFVLSFFSPSTPLAVHVKVTPTAERCWCRRWSGTCSFFWSPGEPSKTQSSPSLHNSPSLKVYSSALVDMVPSTRMSSLRTHLYNAAP